MSHNESELFALCLNMHTPYCIFRIVFASLVSLDNRERKISIEVAGSRNMKKIEKKNELIAS